MASKNRRDEQIKMLEAQKNQLLLRRRAMYDKVEEKKDNMVKGRHPILTSLVLPFIGDRIRENNKRVKKVQELIYNLKVKWPLA